MDANPKEESRQKYQEIRNDVRGRTDRMARSGRDFTTHEFNRLGSALHAAADKLHENNDYFAGFMDTIANKVDDVSHYIENREPKEILNTVQDFAKRNPYFTIGGMFVAGLAASRFLKTGASNEPVSREGYYESGT